MTEKNYRQQTYQQANFILAWYLSILGVLSVGLAYLYSTWVWSLSVSLLTVLLFVVITQLAKHSRNTYFLGALATSVFGWLFVYELNFAVESYFFFFVGAIVLILYQSGQVSLLYMLLVILPQLYFYYFRIQQGKVTSEILLLGALPIVLMTVAGITCAVTSYWLGLISFQKYFELKQAEEKTKSLETSMNWIMQISEGELTTMNDQMLYGITGGTRLIEMKNKLQQAKALEDKEKFMSVGVAQMAEVIANHDYDLEELSKDILKQVVSYFEAQQGTLYLLEEQEDGEMLCLKSAYACNPEKHNRHTLLPAEGFIGQALQTRMVLTIENVADTFFQVASGLGSIKPSAIYAVPLQTNEEIVGVIELATLHPLENYKIELLEKIGETVATSILSINFNATTSALLLESRQLTDRLQNQEAEIKQHLKEYEIKLEAKQREIDTLKAQNNVPA